MFTFLIACLFRNDAVAQPHEVASGLEGLISKFYNYHSTTTNENDHNPSTKIETKPHIIILDMYTAIDMTVAKQPEDTMFYTTYQAIAKHYNIPIWSYRNVVLNGYSNMDSTEHPYLPFIKQNGHLSGKLHLFAVYLMVDHNKHITGLRNNIHPPWHVHLYYADLVASTLLHQLSQCKDHNVNGAHNRVFAPIPPPMHHSTELTCDFKDSKLLHIQYDDVKQNKPLTGTYLYVLALVCC